MSQLSLSHSSPLTCTLKGKLQCCFSDFPNTQISLQEHKQRALSERGLREKPLSAEACRCGSQLGVPVVPGREAVLRVDEVQGSLVVALQRLLLFLCAVVQRVRVDLLNVPFNSADLKCGQRGSAHHADQAVPPAVVIHQVIHPPAHLVVPPLVLPGVMAVTGRRACDAAIF